LSLVPEVFKPINDIRFLERMQGSITQNDLILELRNLTVGYSKKPILNDITFTVKKGEIVGLLGENGAGKTTTIYSILKLLTPWKGEVNIYTHKIGFMLDNSGLLADLTVRENYLFFSKLFSLNPEKEEMKNILEIIGINNFLDKKVKHLSTGLKKRAEIGRALMNNPEFLILDEPTEGIDAIGKVEIKNLIFSLVNNLNCSILFTTHNLLEAENICNSFVFIKHGRTYSISNFELIKESGKTLENFYFEFMKQ